MSERTTREFKTKNTAVPVVVKAYITYRETEEVLKKKELSESERAVEIMKIALVSVNGKTENPHEEAKDIPLPDFIEIQEELAKLVKGDFQTTK